MSQQPSAKKEDVPLPSSYPGQKQAAQQRVAAFPFRFPRDRRRLGGRFSAEEGAKRLLRFFYLERRLAQGLGSWTLALYEMEVKLETGRHIFWHADAAKRLRDRLCEMEHSPREIDDFRDTGIDSFIDELLSAENGTELIAGVHLVAGRALQAAYRHYCDDTCPIADAPTVRLLRQVLSDYEPMLEWAELALQAYMEGGVSEAPVTAWRWHLTRLLESIGGADGQAAASARPMELRSEKKPYVRGSVPNRDSRFDTFKNTGDYNIADGQLRYPAGSYESERLHFIRTQRDEVDAIEAFGTFLWDARFRDFQTEYDLARITWDEARHTEIGHNALQVMGYEPFEMPNRLTSSFCRGPMEVAPAFTEINMFGEVHVMRSINQLIDEARRRNDSLFVHISEYVRADERTHVRKGQNIIKHLSDLKFKDLEYKTRELFTECLAALGALPPGQDLALGPLSREDIERLVGE